MVLLNRLRPVLCVAAAMGLATPGADASGSYNPQLKRRQPRPDAEPARATRMLVNVDQAGVALQGYDPVAFFTQSQPVKGSPEINASHLGASYHFVNADNLRTFRANPDRYAPQYGGFSAFGVSQGLLLKISVTSFQVIGGRLLLHQSGAARRAFERDSLGNIGRADAAWAGLVESKGTLLAR